MKIFEPVLFCVLTKIFKMKIVTHIPFFWTGWISMFPVVLAFGQNEGQTKKMVTGMAAGFAFVVGLILAIVTMWWCCCSKLTERRRVRPWETRDTTRSTSAESRPTPDVIKK